MSIHSHWTHLIVDKSEMECCLAYPKVGSSFPPVIVLMEIFGVNSHIVSVTERLAREGYFAIAPNYFHRTTKNLNLGYKQKDILEGRKHKELTTLDGFLQDFEVLVNFIKSHQKVDQNKGLGCIGFCFGGHLAYITATIPNVKAVASFYGGGIAINSPGGTEPTVNQSDKINAKMICLFGEKDALIPLDQVEIIRQALSKHQKDFEIIVYPNVGHGFFCEQRKDYHASTAQDAWKRVLNLWKTSL